MKTFILPEPELEFGAGNHIDIRFGLMNYGPLGYDSRLAPKQIRLGLIGTNETIEGVCAWLERCRDGIAAKASRQPNLFPRFPGFNEDASFRATLITDTRLQRTIPQATFDALKQQTTLNQIVTEAVDLFVAEVRYLVENTGVDVIICAVPMALYTLLEDFGGDSTAPSAEIEEDHEERVSFDFHDLLKAKSMPLRKPIQIILPMTYDESKRRQQKTRPDRVKRLQDEATRAWNIHTALYYKAGGTPWRIIRDTADYTTCYVGVSFYKTLDESRLHTSIAQVFNERGDGVVVRGGEVRLAKEDRRPHLDETGAYQLLYDALERYRDEHRTLPARVVVHKTSVHNDAEMTGFLRAARSERVELVDLISVHDSFIRLFRTREYPPLRGTLVQLEAYRHVLYTKGSVDFFATYPGMYVPRAIGFRCDHTEQTPKFLAQELLGLTKMNWNNTQFDGGWPITTRAAAQVSAILKYVPENQEIAARYSFYM
jgi:hypothetical protein